MALAITTPSMDTPVTEEQMAEWADYERTRRAIRDIDRMEESDIDHSDLEIPLTFDEVSQQKGKKRGRGKDKATRKAKV